MRVIINGKIHAINGNYDTLMNALQGEDIILNAPCGGIGLCGKCQVTIDHPKHTSSADKKLLTDNQLKEGVRLACTYPMEDGLSLYVKKETMAIETKITIDYSISTAINSRQTTDHTFIVEGFGEALEELNTEPILYGCAVDIGTTTVVMIFFNLKTGEVIGTESFENPQKGYGADVISRISYARTREGQTKLHELIKSALKSHLKTFERTFGRVYHTVISGNTTMGQLLLNMEVSPLGVYPFNFKLKEVTHVKMSEVFGDFLGILSVIPSISAFVGGDLTSGALSLDIHNKDKWQLLIDLGTNGEIILGNKSQFIGTATAAGPVFEGVSLSCGMSAIAGALYDVTDHYKTIGDMPIAGICGTGAISLIHWLLNEEYIDETGRLDEDFQEDNTFPIFKNISLTQEDIRAIQTAKSAIRTGVDILMDTANISTDDIEHVYIAGGFGNKLNIDAFCGIGMIPVTLKDKVKMVGNTSLSGAVKCLLRKESFDEIQTFLEKTKGVHLNEHPDFQDLYMKHMYIKA